MLSYKEYKMLNESLYGSYNLGIGKPNVVGGPIGATGASEVIETEESCDCSLEESKGGKCEKCKSGKKCGKMCNKMMKKGMEDEKLEDEEDSEDEEKEDEDEDEEDSEDEEKEDEEDSEDEDDEEKLEMMKKKSKKSMKKKSKKEWSEIASDVESLLEDKDQNVVDEVKNSLEKIKRLLETKEMTEEEKTWWASVNNQLAGPGEIGFSPIGKIVQQLR